MIPLDPIVWRKDLDPAIKTKLYTFLLSYGRIGTPEEIKAARELIAAMIWSPLHPSTDDQLIPMRKLEASRDILRVQSDAKLSDDEKKKQTADIQAQLAKLDDTEKKAAAAPFQAQLAAFLKADEAGDQAALKKMIADFAASNARTN
jgi:phosphonate transport system substrate-binding protein